MTEVLLTDIKEIFGGRNLYISIDEWKSEPNLSTAFIIADEYSDPITTGRLGNHVSRDIIQLIRSRQIDFVNHPLEINGGPKDMIWPSEGYNGRACRIIF